MYKICKLFVYYFNNLSTLNLKNLNKQDTEKAFSGVKQRYINCIYINTTLSGNLKGHFAYCFFI